MGKRSMGHARTKSALSRLWQGLLSAVTEEEERRADDPSEDPDGSRAGRPLVILRVADKLFVAVLVLSAAVISAMAVATQVMIGRNFTTYVNEAELGRLDPLITALARAYQAEGGWDFLPEGAISMREVARLLAQRPGVSTSLEMAFPAVGDRETSDRLGLLDRAVLISREGRVLVGQAVRLSQSRRQIVVGNQVVGTLSLTPLTQLTDDLEVTFLAEQRLMLWIIAGVALALSGITALMLSRHLLNPLSAIAGATRQLARGRFKTRLEVSRRDELGQLQGDFNALARALEQQEAARRQWVADTSHELRTPLAVLRGEVEAIIDGIHQPTPKVLNTLLEEVMHMGKLIDDLYELARSDAGSLTYAMRDVEPAPLIEPVMALYTDRLAASDLTLTPPAAIPDLPQGRMLLADPDRLRQVFINLLENSLRYTDAGGEIRVSVEVSRDQFVLLFDDSPPAVEPAQMERLFARFYRAEASRNRASGGSGLGLAISRAIIDGHGGTIRAEASPLGGLRIRVSLPLQEAL